MMAASQYTPEKFSRNIYLSQIESTLSTSKQQGSNEGHRELDTNYQSDNSRKPHLPPLARMNIPKPLPRTPLPPPQKSRNMPYTSCPPPTPPLPTPPLTPLPPPPHNIPKPSHLLNLAPQHALPWIR